MPAPLPKNLVSKKIFIHKHASILSAVGLSKADLVHEETQPTYGMHYNQENYNSLQNRFRTLTQKATKILEAEGVENPKIEPFLNLRVDGNFHPTMTPLTTFQETPLLFHQTYEREYGFKPTNRTLLIDDIWLRASGNVFQYPTSPVASSNTPPTPKGKTPIYFDGGWQEVPYFLHQSLKATQTITGPALILLEGSAILIEVNCQAELTKEGNIEIQIQLETKSSQKKNSEALEPIQLSIFSHLFMSIAEQMGKTLQRISISTNIKERLDFSCAIFDAQGGLVANAPHIPVHLGAMGESVKAQLKKFGKDIYKGDVFITNDPFHGGSHLPDVTLITPVLENGKILFFVASRGHHADIGGITPGSMPPFSTTIQQEGIRIEGLKVVSAGEFQEEQIREILSSSSEAGPIPILGCRKIEDNLSDIKAQIAANQKGVELLQEMISSYQQNVVLAYMKHIQENAKMGIIDLIHSLQKNSQKNKNNEEPAFQAEEFLDNGSAIRLKINFLPQNRMKFDFSQTDPELIGNLNAPRAITYSAILYVIRSMVERDIPLNSGCLEPIEIYIPENTLLSPSPDSAVVGGNVETSQRIVDVILKAFQISAGSQGTMNNLTFGNNSFGYYETIAGGAGAGASWRGQHAIHTHMTNTRITDPEILERQYPVLLRSFEIRKDSGGEGQYPGGNGAIREIEFLEAMEVSILSERRVFSPYGLKGASPGKRGFNYIIRKNGKKYNMGGKGQTQVLPGDRIRIETPGGGGYGVKKEKK